MTEKRRVMALRLDDKLVIGVSSRALFDLEEENRIYEEEGLDAYSAYQIEHIDSLTFCLLCFLVFCQQIVSVV